MRAIAGRIRNGINILVLGGLGAGASGAEQPARGPVPFAFEGNRGQTAAPVQFLTRGPGFVMFLLPTEVVFRLASADPSESWPESPPVAALAQSRSSRVVRMKWLGAEARARLEGEGPLAVHTSYFQGGLPERWISSVPNYQRVVSRQIYPGMDLVYYGSGRELEFDLVVAPGARPRAIELAFEGVQSLAIEGDGALALEVGSRRIRLSRPVAYQEIEGSRAPASADYVVRGPNRVGLSFGPYDPGRTLVIDPVLSFSTYLGGSGSDFARAIAVDASGSAVVTGSTLSLDFPAGNGLQEDSGGSADAFVVKLDPSGSSLVYATFLGGSDNDLGRGLVLDPAGNAYVSGDTHSLDFPVRNAFQSRLGGVSDGFVAKLNPTGTALLYSTYLGGSGFDSAMGIAVDTAGNTVLMGQTVSADFPTKNPLQLQLGGLIDAYVAKLDPSGSQLVFSTYLGGSDLDLPMHRDCGDPGDAPGWDVAVDPMGFIYLAGTTESPDFPTVNALQPTHGGNRDAFVAKLDPSGSSLVYSTYIGRAEGDSARAIAVDAFGNAYVTGGSRSPGFPVTPGAFQTVKKGEVYDAFVLKLDGSGSLVYSTFLGGTSSDGGNAIAVDALGNAVVMGQTESPDFPLQWALQGFGGGPTDYFLAKVSATGGELVYSTYLGGSNVDPPCGLNMGVALDGMGSAYVGGGTLSPDFPTAAALQPVLAGDFDAVVAKVRTEPEVRLEVLPEAEANRMIINLSNPGTVTREVEMKLWIDSAALGESPVSLVAVPFQISLPPMVETPLGDVMLPSLLQFPGTTVGVRLLDPISGQTLSLRTCSSSPCP
jgi:hypothetical protein